MRTPTTPNGLRRWDQLDPMTAAVVSWTHPGRDPGWHEQARQAVRDAMPVLARALDRLAEQET